MERIISFDKRPWDQSVYSVIRETQCAASFHRACRESAALFHYDTSAALWPGICRFYAEAAPQDPETLRDYIGAAVEKDAYWLGTNEENLIKLLLMGSGSAPFVMPMAPAAENLILRDWCFVDHEGTSYVLQMRDDICQTLMSLFQNPAFQITRRMIFRLEAIVHSLVFIYGYANLEFAANMICEAVNQTGLTMSKPAFLRSVRGFTDYYLAKNGEEYLIHPALRDPEGLIGQAFGVWDGNMAITIQNLEGSMNACLPKEREAVESANRFFDAFSRQDPDTEHMSENVYYMFKQGAGRDETEAYVLPKLVLSGNRQLRHILDRLQADIVPWGAAKRGFVS